MSVYDVAQKTLDSRSGNQELIVNKEFRLKSFQ